MTLTIPRCERALWLVSAAVSFVLSDNSTEAGRREEWMLPWWLATASYSGVRWQWCVFFFFYHFPLVSWSQTCKLFFHTIKVKWWRWAKSEGFGLSWLSEWGRRRDGGREYKLDAYVSDMMANKKRLLVLVSTGPHCLNLMKIGWAQRNSDKLNGPSKALLVL